MQLPLYAQDLVKQALAMGAVDAVPFVQSEIPYDARTLLKCMYGCKDWGYGLTCPSRPGTPTIAEHKEMFSLYRWGILIHTHEKNISQKISLALEGDAFRAGYYFAFSLSDCGLCSRCAGFEQKECRFPDKARPALHSVGIDVFRFAKQKGLPLYTLSEDGQQQNWYSAVFIE